MCGTPLRTAFARMRATASAEMSIASASVHWPREPQRESAVVAEAVEQPAARVARRRLAVLALIEKQPGLLALAQIDLVLDRALRARRPCRAPRRQHRRPSAPALRAPAPWDRCAPGCPPARAAREHAGHRRQQPIHALRQRLHDQVVAVAIDDERRQQVRLAVHEPVRGRVELRATRGTESPLEPRPQQRLVGRRVAARQHPDRNLRPIAEERVAERAPPRTDHLDDVAALGVARRRRRRGRSTDGPRARAARRAR